MSSEASFTDEGWRGMASAGHSMRGQMGYNRGSKWHFEILHTALGMLALETGY